MCRSNNQSLIDSIILTVNGTLIFTEMYSLSLSFTVRYIFSDYLETTSVVQMIQIISVYLPNCFHVLSYCSGQTIFSVT